MRNIFSIAPANSIVAIAVILMPLMLASCQESVTESVGNLFGSSDEAEEVINTIALTPEEIPWHIQSAVGATVSRLKGGDPAVIDERFSITGSGGIGTDDNIDLSGFGVENVQLNDFFHPKDAPGINRLGARLIMVEPTGRRVGISFVADYELTEDKVVLKGHQWGYMRAEFPVAETYIVPTAAIEELGKDGVRDYTTFRTHIILNALQAGEPNASQDMSDYTIVTFFMDRLLHGDKVELRLSEVKDGPEGFAKDSRYIVHGNGWVTGIVPGKFSLAADKAFWVKAVFIPKKKDEGGFFSSLLTNEKLIGLYNTANLTESSS